MIKETVILLVLFAYAAGLFIGYFFFNLRAKKSLQTAFENERKHKFEVFYHSYFATTIIDMIKQRKPILEIEKFTNKYTNER